MPATDGLNPSGSRRKSLWPAPRRTLFTRTHGKIIMDDRTHGTKVMDDQKSKALAAALVQI